MKPTKPGFYWVHRHAPNDRELLVIQFDLEEVNVPGDDYTYEIEDFVWLHSEPLTPPGSGQSDKEFMKGMIARADREALEEPDISVQLCRCRNLYAPKGSRCSFCGCRKTNDRT